MGLMVRLQSDPQSLRVAPQRGVITITVNAGRLAHWGKKKGAADLTKHTRTTAN